VTKKLVFVLLLLVCLPLALVVWAGVWLARHEQELMRQRFRELLTEQLRDTDQTVARYFQRCEGDLLRLTELETFEPSRLRDIVRAEPLATQLFVLESDGRLLHPPLDGPLNDAERAFLQRARRFLLDKDLVRAASSSSAASANGDGMAAGAKEGMGQVSLREQVSADSASSHGWYVWYWERGLNLVFWRRAETGHVVGIELDRSRWIADLISDLPTTAVADDVPTSQSRIRLVDSNASIVYQWGEFEPPSETSPVVEMPLSIPLTSWRLQYFVEGERLIGISSRTTYFSLISGLVAVAICLAGLAVYFYRESSRELREAATRVNFVNQVSHELRTPLTNICLYADLLEHDLESVEPNEARRPQERLKVITAESQRLSRLIGNVLTFARQQRDRGKLKRKAGRVDDVARAVIRQFEPTMAQKGIEIRFDGNASDPVQFDIDALEQILVNLLSNVEKYAASGKLMEVSTGQTGDRTTIEIADHGPGIAGEQREKVFQPFYRMSDRLEGATGAGIGLSIARNLARLHGGEVDLLDTDTGATFRVELLTPKADDGVSQ